MTRSKIIRISYYFIVGVLLGAGWLKLGTPLITILFGLLALRLFRFAERNWVAISLYIVLVSTIFYGFIVFIQETVTALPHVAEASVPIIVDYANKYKVALPFNDVEGAKKSVADSISDELRGLAKFAEIATKEFVYLIIGLVVAASLFVGARFSLDDQTETTKTNFYNVLCGEIAIRFKSFFDSFRIVMGAQLIISSINTAFTGIFVYSIGLPYASMTVVITFLCGLLPIVGNLMSNTVITCIAITTSPSLALIALAFLIILHKFEYFLNSKIIGGRIKNPMWLTLLGLVVGERIMGIPGMILAPVVLHYIKVECSRYQVEQAHSI